MILKKNQALGGCWAPLIHKSDEYLQSANNPLHDAQVIHHLHKSNEENDRRKYINKEPEFVDRILVEEEDSSEQSLMQEIGCKCRYPMENFETCICLQDEQGDGLLQEKTDNNGWPG